MAVAVESSQAQSSRSGPSRDRVELILQSLDRLPTLPPVVARLLSLTSSEDSSAREVTEVLQADPALSAGILRLARSAHTGVAAQHVGVQQAVTLLGFRAVRSAVLSRQFFDVFRTSAHEDGAHRSELWRHCLATACAAEWIAKHCNAGVEPGDAFLCGVLHDVGKIALDTCLPKSYARVVERTLARGECVCDVEREIFGLDHMVAGKRVATRWGLPHPIIECVWLHHHEPSSLPSGIGARALIAVVRLADQVVRSAGIGFSGYRSAAHTAPLAEQLGISAESMARLAEWLPERTKELEQALGIGTAEPGDAALNEAALAHLRRVNAVLTDANRKLSARVSCFDIVADFNERVGATASIGEVCAAAAAAITGVGPSNEVCTFAAAGDGGCVYCAWAPGSQESPTTAIHEHDEFAAALTAANGAVLGRAPRELQQVWEACMGVRSRGELWLMPLNREDVVGGVLIVDQQDSCRWLRENAQDAAGVARAIATALASAFAQSRSERMAEELVDLNRRLREAQADLLRGRSLAMVAQMAAGAAHELNNPLAVISARAQMDLRHAQTPELRKSFETIVSQTNKAAQIVLDLMHFAKPDPPTPIDQPLRQVLEAVFQHWQGIDAGRAARLSISLHDPDAAVHADAAQLIQALNAVVANALDATEKAGRVYINSARGPSDETVRIVIRDEGAGMAPEVLEHAMDPFFSSRAAGRGRGLGLSLAHRFVEINGGKLWLQSTPNLGTTATIELPARAPAGAT